MAEFGARLKAAREQRGVSLRQIAGATRISMTALEALERDDFSRLPGGIFSRAFVRAYAVEVGLDPEATVAEFLVEFGRHERESAIETARPEVTEEDRAFLERQQQATRWFRIIAVLVILGIIGIGLWQGQRLLHEFSPREAAAPKSTARVPEPPPAPTTSASEPVIPAPPAGSLTIEFSVTADCSVQVAADGQDVFFKTMRPGDSKVISAQRELQVQIDNAGAFEWTINGRPAKSLGALNERKKVTITPATIAKFLQ